jgi:alpha-methylacyl-CoA racemase
MACALLDATRTGRGRVVDGAIVDVLGMLGTIAMWVRSGGQLDSETPSVFHDSPFYDVYVCSDGRYLTLGALEPQFYRLLIDALGLNDVDPACQYDVSTWPELKARFKTLFASHTLSYWRELLEGTDVCFAPVLNIEEAAAHPHNVARDLYRVESNGAVTTRVAPKFLPLADE